MHELRWIIAVAIVVAWGWAAWRIYNKVWVNDPYASFALGMLMGVLTVIVAIISYFLLHSWFSVDVVVAIMVILGCETLVIHLVRCEISDPLFADYFVDLFTKRKEGSIDEEWKNFRVDE